MSSSAASPMLVDAVVGSALSVHGVRKTYGATRALHDVHFDVGRGEVHALLGGNGSGKSTLIKVLAGVVQADPGGTIRVGATTVAAGEMSPAAARSAGLHFVHQHPTVFPDLSVAENIALGQEFAGGGIRPVRWRQLTRRASVVLERFEVPATATQLVRTLPPATRTMVAIARALQDQEDAGGGALLLDEPTAALPKAEVSRLLAALRRLAARGQTVVFVTHRVDEVLAVADRATVLRDGNVVTTTDVAGLDERSIIELTAGRRIERLYPTRGVGRVGDVELACSQLRAGPLQDVSLSVRAGEVVGIAGLLGSGRTELLQTVFGALPIVSGEVQVAGRRLGGGVAVGMSHGVAYIPEDRGEDAAFAEMPVFENISAPSLRRYWRGLRMDGRRERGDGRSAVREFAIKTADIRAPLSSLSGGNQQKAILARWLTRSPRVLLLDEPTQGVDVESRAEIYLLIRRAADAGCAVLLVSSDFDELSNVADRVLVLAGGVITAAIDATALDGQMLTEIVYREEAR
jgi:ribose transport system ATP-binding protein